MYVNEKLVPFKNETLTEYRFRLYALKETEGLTWRQIANLIENHYDKKYSFDYLRHESYGVKNQKQVIESNIGTRILVLSDLHYPYNLPISSFDKYRNKVDILVLNGDLQDCQGISKFSKSYRVPFVDELAGARNMLIEIIKTINAKKVVLNYGNHEERMIRHLSDKLNEDMLELMPDNPLDLIVNDGFMKFDRFNNTKIWYTPIKEALEDEYEVIYTGNWWCKIGKTIFAHPKAYKSGILGTAEKAWTHFSQLGEDFQAVVLAHTHQLGFTKYGDYFIYESGCLCYPQSYATSGGMNKPQAQGYIYLTQDVDGNFLYDHTKIEVLNKTKDKKVKQIYI